MKILKLIVLFLFLMLSLNLSAQNSKIIDPSFPGGRDSLNYFLAENLIWPSIESCVEGMVIVSFIVDASGTLSNFEVKKGLHEAFDKEAMRVVQLMPKWEPGTVDGKAVDYYYFLPIGFRIE